MGLFGGITHEELRRRKFAVIGVGLALSILGLLALSMPLMASIAIETLVGWLILGVGLSQAVATYRALKNGERAFFKLLWSIIALSTGIILLARPLSGVLTLTMLMSVYFVMEGVFKISISMQLRPIDGWKWILFSGIMAVVLAGIIWSDFFAAAWAVGLIVGLNLLFTGVSFMSLGWRVDR